MDFAKGHGTGNDFVILPDPDGQLSLTPALVAALCDRHRGVGADGVLRVIRSAKHPEAAGYATEAEWFMDYWNADGSYAEMCGNGTRVFTRYLLESGLATADPGGVAIATRAGVVRAVVGEREISVGLRPPRREGVSAATVAGRSFAGTAVDCGNPHLVCTGLSTEELSTLDLTRPPEFDAIAFPAGVNIEFVAADEPIGISTDDLVGGAAVEPVAGAAVELVGGAAAEPVAAATDGLVRGVDVHVRMRVYERGSAETLSCGSGACAVAAVALAEAGLEVGTVAVDVSGGRLTVTLDGEVCWLAGPAVIVARGEIDVPSLTA